jgi:nucleoid DNA-binding protein
MWRRSKNVKFGADEDAMVKERKGSETRPALLKLDELSKVVGQKCKVSEKVVKRVMRATMIAVGEAVEKGGRTRVQGLGMFTRTAAKEDGKFRIRFKPQVKKVGKGAGKGGGKGTAAEDAD